ncbi:MAG: DUF2203 domain-containing protein [Thermoplasmata archaeon]
MSRDMRSEPPGSSTPPRTWTVDEANARLPGLRELLDKLREWAVRLSEVHAELRRLTEFWGTEVDAPDHADHHLKRRLEAEWKNLSRRLDESIESLRAEAIEVKAIDTGLVDFCSIQDGELVYLCWRRDEPAVGFYHPLTGGFRTRRPLPDPGEPAVTRAGLSS